MSKPLPYNIRIVVPMTSVAVAALIEGFVTPVLLRLIVH